MSKRESFDPYLRRLIAENCRRLRLAQGISQEALSELCGFHRTYISQLERAVVNVTVDNIQLLADGLGVHPIILVRE
ncbi:helix-turn-helix transcriptional regulator [Pandoraea pnomenusa]|uniref:helix-turn-helix domain-containing protein n=1 Tax=Pandoraea pnomenusa TaxID=93220 RepID=UPI0033426DA1